MGFAFCLFTSPLSRSRRFDALTCVESGSTLPPFKNLGRGIF